MVALIRGCHEKNYSENFVIILAKHFNPFVLNVSFLYHLKISENLTIFYFDNFREILIMYKSIVNQNNISFD